MLKLWLSTKCCSCREERLEGLGGEVHEAEEPDVQAGAKVLVVRFQAEDQC